MGFESLRIKKFRSINEIELKDLKKINILVGKNNCGKTSILEAFFLLSGMSNSALVVNIENFRQTLLSSDEDFKNIFKDLDFNTPINIQGVLNNKKRQLTISPRIQNYNPKSNEQIQGKNILVSSQAEPQVKGLMFQFFDEKNKYVSSIHIDNGDIRPAFESRYKEEIDCKFLYSKYVSYDDLVKEISSFAIEKKLDKLIETLDKIDSRVIDIRTINNKIYLDIGMKTLFPLHIMGDGMVKILSIISSIQYINNGILLIDEIENGLFYSSLRILWGAIINACEKNDVQIVATTHSYENIKALMDECNNNNYEDVMLYRISNENEKQKAFETTSQDLKIGLDNNIEVR